MLGSIGRKLQDIYTKSKGIIGEAFEGTGFDDPLSEYGPDRFEARALQEELAPIYNNALFKEYRAAQDKWNPLIEEALETGSVIYEGEELDYDQIYTTASLEIQKIYESENYELGELLGAGDYWDETIKGTPDALYRSREDYVKRLGNIPNAEQSIYEEETALFGYDQMYGVGDFGPGGRYEDWKTDNQVTTIAGKKHKSKGEFNLPLLSKLGDLLLGGD